jgi:hypothetical protein
VSDLDAYKLEQVEAAQKRDREDIDDLREREAIRDVKVQVATTVMNRITVLFGGVILAIVGAAAAVLFGGGGH